MGSVKIKDFKPLLIKKKTGFSKLLCLKSIINRVINNLELIILYTLPKVSIAISSWTEEFDSKTVLELKVSFRDHLSKVGEVENRKQLLNIEKYNSMLFRASFL